MKHSVAPGLALPRTRDEALQVIEIKSKEIIIANYTRIENGSYRLDATNASKQIAQMIATNLPVKETE